MKNNCTEEKQFEDTNNLDKLHDKSLNCYIDISIVISSCLINQGKFDCLHRVIENLKYFLPNSDIVIGFDKVGPNELQKEVLNNYNNTSYFIHSKGLGYSFNQGNKLCKHDIILQTEDDWIIDNKYLITENDVKTLLFNCCLVLNKYKKSCVRLDGGMFDEIGGSDGYPLGWIKHKYENKFFYYEYNLPNEEQIYSNFWLKYAFSNHPHLKFKNMTLENPYPEDIDPGQTENNYAIEWILNSNPIFYVPINEISIQVAGWTNPDKNIFKHIGSHVSYRKK